MKKLQMLGLATVMLTGQAFAAPQLDQSNLGISSAGTAMDFNDYFAQVITVGLPGVLSSVDFSIRKFDGATFGDVTVQIRNVTALGVPDTTILGSKTFANAAISPNTDEFTTFDLKDLNLTFDVGDTFAIVLSSPNQSGSPFPIDLTVDEYVGGKLYFSPDGSLWFIFTDRDARFRTFMEEPVQVVGIDIKPGSDPNSINLCNNGAVPVAILGSDTFDVLDVNTETLRFAEAAVKVVGKKDPHSLCNYDDVNGDFFADLVCNYVTQDIAALDGESTTATVNGELLDGTPIEGTDSVNIVKDTCS